MVWPVKQSLDPSGEIDGWYSSSPLAACTSVSRIGLLVALATAEGSAGMLEEGRRTLLEVLDTLPEQLRSLRVRILPLLALVGHMLGHHGEATALLRRSLSELDDPDGAEAAELGVATALDCLYEPDRPAMHTYARRAARAAQRSGDAGLQAVAAGVMALALYNSGELEEAAERCGAAAEGLASLTDSELTLRLEGVFSVAWTAMSLERWEECLVVADRGLAVSRLNGQQQLIVPLTIARTVARAWQGELTEAATAADELIDGTRLSGSGQWVAWALTLRGWVAGLAGDLDLASACGEEACAITASQSRTTYFVAHARLHLAETRLEQGEAQECLTALLAAAGGPQLPVCEPPIRPRYFEILTRASLALDRLSEARGWARAAGAAAAGSPIGGRRCEATLAEAGVALAEGDHSRAEVIARQGVQAAASSGDRLLAARAQLVSARAMAPRDRAGAIALLEEARDELESCGAVRARAEADRELRRLGRRVGRGGARGRGDQGVRSLSGREREVAGLVTEGLSNREIAARLFLSDKTVETHLSAVFRKLGVRGRAAVGAALSHDDRDAVA